MKVTLRKLSSIGSCTLTVALALFTLYSYTEINIDHIPDVNPITLEDPQPISIMETVGYYRSISKISLSEKDMKCLEHNIYYEAGVEDHYGKIAVAQVTYNRLKTGQWGKSICSVVYAPHQFSWTKQRKAAPAGKLWEESRQAAKDFVNGLRVVNLHNSLYYHATWIDRPSWTYRKQEVQVIGQHIFYAKIN